MPPPRGRAEKEQTEFDFDPEGDVTLVFTLTEKEPEAAENGTARAASVPNPIGTLSSARFSPYPAPTPGNKRIEMRVSSRHLILASPVFKVMLTSGFKEGETLRKEGKVEIPLPEDESDTFAIWMNILHGRHRRVRAVLPIDLLASFGALLDKYQASLEPIEIFSAYWLSSSEISIQELMKKPFNKKNVTSILHVTSISWVFGHDMYFKISTARLGRINNWSLSIFKQHVQEELSNLPLPDNLFESIEKFGEKYKSAINNLPLTWIKSYHSTTVNCPCGRFGCDALVLGCLQKAFLPEGLIGKHWDPSEDHPTPTAAYDACKSKIQSMKLKLLCEHHTFHERPGPKQIALRISFQQELDGLLDKTMCGLDLKDFK